MPGFDPDAGAGIFQGFVLQPGRIEPEAITHGQEGVPASGHEMHHRLVADAVAVEPDASVQRVDHSLAAALEGPHQARQEQLISPSMVEDPTGVAVPMNR